MSLDILGDRWSLLIIRDLMVRGYRTFKQFQQAGEGIASNILTDRLRMLESAEIIASEADESDGRKVNYRLTGRGIDLAPVLLELLIWGARHEESAAPCAVLDHMEQNREAVLPKTRRRWKTRAPPPLFPKFEEKTRRKKSPKK